MNSREDRLRGFEARLVKESLKIVDRFREHKDPILKLIADTFDSLIEQAKLTDNKSLSSEDKERLYDTITKTNILFDRLVTAFENKKVNNESQELKNLETLKLSRYKILKPHLTQIAKEGKTISDDKLIAEEKIRQEKELGITIHLTENKSVTTNLVKKKLDEEIQYAERLQERVDDVLQPRKNLEASITSAYSVSQSDSHDDSDNSRYSQSVSDFPSVNSITSGYEESVEKPPEAKESGFISGLKKYGPPILGLTLAFTAVAVATVFTLGATGVIGGVGLLGATAMAAGGGGFAAIGTTLGATSTAAATAVGTLALIGGSAIIATLSYAAKKGFDRLSSYLSTKKNENLRAPILHEHVEDEKHRSSYNNQMRKVFNSEAAKHSRDEKNRSVVSSPSSSVSSSPASSPTSSPTSSPSSSPTSSFSSSSSPSSSPPDSRSPSPTPPPRRK